MIVYYVERCGLYYADGPWVLCREEAWSSGSAEDARFIASCYGGSRVIVETIST